MRHHSRCYLIIGAIITLAGPMAGRAEAQDTVGGHFGVLFPLVTHGNGTTIDIADDFTIGFPVGITVRRSPAFAFDLELVPSIQNEPLDVNLTVHPGVLWTFGGGWTTGIRMAFEINQASWGFTPLVNYGLFAVGRGSSVFAEAVVPIRFQQTAAGENFTSIGLGIHIGVGF